MKRTKPYPQDKALDPRGEVMFDLVQAVNANEALPIQDLLIALCAVGLTAATGKRPDQHDADAFSRAVKHAASGLLIQAKHLEHGDVLFGGDE